MNLYVENYIIFYILTSTIRMYVCLSGKFRSRLHIMNYKIIGYYLSAAIKSISCSCIATFATEAKYYHYKCQAEFVN